MSRKSVENALSIVCEMLKWEKTSTLSTIWDMGLSDKTDEEIQRAIVNFCKKGESKYSMTPFEFMENADPTGSFAAKKRLEETRKMLAGED